MEAEARKALIEIGRVSELNRLLAWLVTYDISPEDGPGKMKGQLLAYIEGRILDLQ